MIDRLLFTLEGIRTELMRCALFALIMGVLIIGQAFFLTSVLTSLWYGQDLIAQIPFIAGFTLCFFVRQFVDNIQNKGLDAYATKRANEFRTQLFRTAFNKGQPLFQKQGTGSFTTLLIEGVDRVEAYLRMVLPRMIRLVVIPVLLLILLFYLDWVSGIIALLVFPAIILQMTLIGSTASIEAGKQHQGYQRLANHFTDTLRGIDTLKLFGRSQDQADSIFESSERFRKATIKTLRIATLSGAVLDAFSTISIAAIAVMLGFRLVDGSLTLFPALFVLVLIPDYFKPIREFASDYHASLDGKNALHSIVELLEPSAQWPSTSHPTTTQPDSALPDFATPKLSAWNENSTLTLNHVSFAYDIHTTLRDLTCTCIGNQKVGIIGTSGSGKSTLAHLLAGIMSPISGSLVYNDTQLDTLSCPAWRSQVVYIPQDPHIFHTSLYNNLAFYQPDASIEKVEHVVSLMGLESLVQELPDGLQTTIGEGAHAISGGQAQRIAFARAFLHKNCHVLIFDEPTAHLDIETELELKTHMLKLMKDKLVFFATHRLHWLSAMDTVLLLKDGAIVASGRPQELVNSCEYQNFVEQTQGGSHG